MISTITAAQIRDRPRASGDKALTSSAFA
jgi:hypothetical protein